VQFPSASVGLPIACARDKKRRLTSFVSGQSPIELQVVLYSYSFLVFCSLNVVAPRKCAKPIMITPDPVTLEASRRFQLASNPDRSPNAVAISSLWTGTAAAFEQAHRHTRLWSRHVLRRICKCKSATDRCRWDREKLCPACPVRHRSRCAARH